MGLAILGVLIVCYFVLAYFAAKTWEVWHVVLLVFLFLSTVVFSMFAAATLKVQQRWRGQYEQLAKDVDTETSLHERLTHGSLSDGELGEPALRGEVRRATVDRGRVWRNLRLAELGEGQLLLDATAWGAAGCRSAAAGDEVDADEAAADEANADEAAMEEPAEDVAAADAAAAGGAAPAVAPEGGAAPAAPVNTLGLEENAVVFAFKEAPLRTLAAELRSVLLDETDETDEAATATPESYGLCKVPVYYMGEYKVVGNPQESPGALKLAPSIPLSESQIQQLQDADSTWVLYEIMPVDSHTEFSGLAAQQLAQLLASPELPAPVLESLVQEYVRDGQAATDQDPPERKWLRIKFTQAHTEDVDVDAAAAGEQPLADSLFDPSGRSLVATLNQGTKTEFQPGDEAEFDFATAQALIAEGKAEQVQPIYNRRLRDYARAFRSYAAELLALDRQIATSGGDLQKLADSLAQLQRQVTFQNEQRGELEFDRDGLQTELRVLSDYRGVAEAKLTELRTDLSRLYRTNKQLVGRLTSAR